MAREIEVVYENGVFKPQVPVCLPEGHRLKLYIPYEQRNVTPEQVLQETRELQEAFADMTDQEWEEFRADVLGPERLASMARQAKEENQ